METTEIILESTVCEDGYFVVGESIYSGDIGRPFGVVTEILEQTQERQKIKVRISLSKITGATTGATMKFN